MAKVEKSEVEEVVRKRVASYTITLNQEEAEVLQILLAKVGGHEEKSARGITQEIFEALHKHGIRYRDSAHYYRSSGQIDFD